MSDSSPFGFARFVPGFDFLQNLAQGAAAGMPAMPALSEWVAPTMSVEEIDKRIQEFKTVQFWLEQNARALAATVQALEVQRMTLATLKDMNMAVGDMAAAMGGPQAPGQQPAGARAKAQAATAPGVDPMQWWGAVTQQFQQIAERAVQDAGPTQAAFEASREMAGNAFKAASDMAAQWAPGAANKAAPAKSEGARAAAPTARAAGKKTAAAKKAAPKAGAGRRAG